jgi:hypothetical protein
MTVILRLFPTRALCYTLTHTHKQTNKHTLSLACSEQAHAFTLSLARSITDSPSLPLRPTFEAIQYGAAFVGVDDVSASPSAHLAAFTLASVLFL